MPTPTSSQPGPEDPAITQFIQSKGMDFIGNQYDLEQFKSWIITQPGIDQSGYIDSIDDPVHKATTLLWYGSSSPQQASIIAEASRRGINLAVERRDHSMQQINAAIAATWRSAAQGGWQGFSITDIVGISPDFDGIIVEGTYTATPATRRAPQVNSLAT